MPDFLQRSQAPLTDAQWSTLEQAVISTARAMLVGRRFISIVGPLGSAVEVLPSDVIAGSAMGLVDLLGVGEGEAVSVQRRRYVPVPLLFKDFWLHWRDLEANQELGLPLDTGQAAAAAAAVAQAEDRLVFDGDPTLGLPGLRNAPGRQTRQMSDWGQMGQAFADVVQGVRALTAAGFPGPYALAVSPQLYAELNRIFDATGVLELEQVEKLARRGVYPAAVLPEPSAILVDSGPQNVDLALGLDYAVAYVTTDDLNHKLRVLESLVLRIRRPAAICTFEPAEQQTSPEARRKA